MENVSIILLGSNMAFLDLKKIKTVKSKLFKIIEVKVKAILPEPKHITGYLDQEYLDDQLRMIVGPDEDHIRICIINCRLEDNFYVRRIFDKTAVLSIWMPMQILESSSISIENFIIKNIYEMISIYVESGKRLTSKEAYSIPHIDTRGCLYDMNGNIATIVYNTERPIICDECKTRIRKRSLEPSYIRQLEKELRKIKKSIIVRIELYIKKYPLLSLLLTILLGIIINILSNIVIALF